jgi:hypothetical protein
MGKQSRKYNKNAIKEEVTPKRFSRRQKKSNKLNASVDDYKLREVVEAGTLVSFRSLNMSVAMCCLSEARRGLLARSVQGILLI